MRIDRLQIINFRNLAAIDVSLGSTTVIVGENRSGKSNLLHALRLVLDPGLSHLDRELGPEDFWEGLSDGSSTWDPMESGEKIEVAVEFSEIEEDDALLMAVLGEALIEGDPMRARLLYRFAPIDTGEEEGDLRYAWQILGGAEEREIKGDLRRFLRQVHLHALRDVSRDINSWRRSPLKPQLRAAAEQIGDADLERIADAVTEANDEVARLEAIEEVGKAIGDRMKSLVGEAMAPETTLAVASTEPKRLLRSLRVLVEAAQRPLSSSSLGTLNILYLVLVELGLRQQLDADELAHLVLSIEEPEAHLHPHVQRLVFSDILRPDADEERSFLVTSHSPHIVSVAPPKSLVILREGGDGGTQAAAAATADLSEAEWDDIERYLDATRGEIVFARKVMLVEGFAEQVLVPRLAEDAGYDLDKEGISVCAVHGVHFGTYCRYLSALRIPWAVVSDGDPDEDGESRGEERARKLAARLGEEGADPAEHGVFVGDVSLEPDLIAVDGNLEPMVEALRSFSWKKPTRERLAVWEASGEVDDEAFQKTLKRAGKGRFAQRLAAIDGHLAAPPYIAHAIEYLTQVTDDTA